MVQMSCASVPRVLRQVVTGFAAKRSTLPMRFRFLCIFAVFVFVLFHILLVFVTFRVFLLSRAMRAVMDLVIGMRYV